MPKTMKKTAKKMPVLTKTQERVVTVLARLGRMASEDEDFVGYFSEDLQKLLESIHNEDGFGTEGQCDPRGDFRNGHWSMDHVEGIDD